MTLSALRQRSDDFNLFIFDGKERDGLIDLCHLRNYMPSRSYKEASQALNRFKEELVQKGFIQVVRSLSKDRPLGVKIVDCNLRLMAKQMGDSWLKLRTSNTFHMNTDTVLSSATVADREDRKPGSPVQRLRTK